MLRDLRTVENVCIFLFSFFFFFFFLPKLGLKVCIFFFILKKTLQLLWFLAHLSRRLTRWAYRMGLEPAFVRPSVRPHFQTWLSLRPAGRLQSNFVWSIIGSRGKVALGFGAHQIKNLVSMATDISHRVIMGKRASSRFLGCFWLDPFDTCR